MGTGTRVVGTSHQQAPVPDLSSSPIRSERYWSPEFASREWEPLWPHVWLVAGRVDQLAVAGDYVTYDIGRDAVIAVLGETPASAHLLR